MDQLIRHVTFYGSPYEFSLLREGLSALPHLEIERINQNPLEAKADLLVIGHSLPDFDSNEILKSRVPGKGPTSVVSISHGPYPQNGLPSPADAAKGAFHFRWVSDVGLAPHILHLVEDHLFAEHYYHNQHRRFLILLEDEISYASFFVPIILKELRDQTLSLMPTTSGDALMEEKEAHERPVLLLASNYEQACSYLERYGDRMVGVISSLGFPQNGSNNLNAGFQLVDRVKALPMEIPVVIQTSQPDMKKKIKAAGASFMNKNGPRMLQQLREYLVEYFGFGDFIFRMPDTGNTVVAKAKTLDELRSCVEWVPLKSFIYHAKRRHFSNWLGVHGHLELAETIRPIPADAGEEARAKLIELLQKAQ